MSGTEFKFAN